MRSDSARRPPRRPPRRAAPAGAAANLSFGQVLAWRLERQLLQPIGSLGVPETVSAVCGIQAQVPSLLALLAAGRTWERDAWRRAFGLDPGDVETLAAAVTAALDGRVLDREELIEEIAERSGRRDLEEQLRSGWGAVLKPLAWMGHLCNEPSRGARVTFTRPDTWFSDWHGLPTVDAAARVAIPAYLRAHGPATLKSFHAWLARESGRVTEVRRWFDLAADLLVSVTVEGEPCWALAEDLDGLRAARPARGVRLIGGFDQYVLGPGRLIRASWPLIAASR